MKQLITFLLCLFTLFAEAQVNTNDTNKYFKSYDYGFSYKRLQAREAFIFPTDTVINKLGAVSLNGVIYLGNGTKWTSIGGGAGTTPNLQQVTNVGSITTNPITVQSLNLTNTDNLLTLTGNGDGNFTITRTGTPDELLKVNDGTSGYLKFGGGAGQYVQINTNSGANVELNAPTTSGTIPISVNGYTANSAGAITIPTGGVAVDTIFRTLGKDSIFYKKNNITYAIKDSVGTNPAPVGYYGAFQDTTTQTAASINTAYPVNLKVTDLSNGITISNNSKIKIANAGIYNIQFSLQLEKSGGSGNMIADIWLRKNGVNIQGTTGKVVLTGSANASPVIAAWNYVVALSSNDSLELMWATTNDNVVIKAYSATSPHPSIPSAILTVTQQSGIMAGTGISPLDTANMLNPYLQKNDTASTIATKTNLNNYVNLTTAQTIAGQKTFSSQIKMPTTGSNLILQILSDGTIASMASATYPTPVELAYVKGVTSAIQTQINSKVNISDTATMLNKYLRKTDTASLSNRIDKEFSDLDILQSLSFGIKAEPYGITLATTTSQLGLTSAIMNFYPFNWNVSDSIRGIAFLNRATTTLTSTNYNGVAIYSLSGGTLTRLTFTTNSGTFWDGTLNTWKTNAITPYYLPKGVYYLGYQVTGSAGLPTIASGTTMQAGLIEPPTAINPNGIKIAFSIANNTASAPTSVAMSATTTTQRVPYFILY